MTTNSGTRTTQEDRGVSPVVGVILMVAVTVMLSVAVGGLVLDLGSSLGGPNPSAGVSAEEINGGYEVQLVDSQNVDEVRIETTDGETHTLSAVGESVTIHSRNPGQFTVIGVVDGEEQVLMTKRTSGNWVYDSGDGDDGATTISSTQVVNDYTHLTSNVAAGATTLEVNNGSAFSSGDEVLIIQMQDSDGDKAGTYEFRDIESVSGNTLTLTSSLDNGFETGEYTTRSEPRPASNPGTVTQVVRIPQYTDVTIDGGTVTAPAWNGKTGGIAFFRASGTVEFVNGGEMNVTGKGFRGGTCGDCGDDWDGGRGEGVNGWHYGGGEKHYAEEVSLNNRNGGGGSNVTNNNGGDPAAGGGLATAGEDAPDSHSSYDSIGGEAIGDSQLSKMHLGGGGGAGSDNDGYTPLPENSHGGGIAGIAANEIVDAAVYADGIDGIAADHQYGGISGGGAGGVISLTGDSVTTVEVSAEGGDRDSTPDGETSGAGGDGYVRVSE